MNNIISVEGNYIPTELNAKNAPTHLYPMQEFLYPHTLFLELVWAVLFFGTLVFLCGMVYKECKAQKNKRRKI